MPRPTTSQSAVFEPAGLVPASVIRPAVAVRLELLRIVWRPDRNAADAIKVCEALEAYISGKEPG